MDELLELLRNEFELDIDLAQAALDAAHAEPARAAQHLEGPLDFLNRSFQASELAGLEGLSQWIDCVSQNAVLAAETADVGMLDWLRGWIAPAHAYLVAPAQEEAVLGCCQYLLACPDVTTQNRADSFATLLSVVPQLAAEEVPEQPDAIVDTDVSLSVDDADPGLLGAMLSDAQEQVERLRVNTQGLADGTATPAQLLEAQRVAHTLKGSGNIVGVIGVARVSHYLEDLMEHALAQLNAGESIPASMARDASLSIETLGQMFAFLLGEERQPTHAKEVLQRLADWRWHIQAHQVDAFDPPAIVVAEESVTTDDAGAVENAGAAASAAGQTVRVDAERLSRLLRRASQSLFTVQRLSQWLNRTREDLLAAQLKQRELDVRMREMQGYIDRHVVDLRAQRDAGETFDALEMDRYDSMYSLSRFIMEDVHDQSALSNEALKTVEQANEVLRGEQWHLTVQHRDLMSARMVPAKSIIPRLRRNVQQTAGATGKSVELVVEGEQTTLDADVLTQLTEPLLHLVRNAVDHGIESPEKRSAANKSPIGRVTISFKTVGQEIEVVCADDGRGLDAYAIHQKAIDFGLAGDNEALTPEQIYRLVLLPGFSTKNEITEISGRGVGLDVVHDRVVAMKGRVRIESTQHQGTRFILRVPISIGSANVLIVRVAEQMVALPVENVTRALAPGQFTLSPDAASITVEQTQSNCHDLAARLGFERARAIDPSTLCVVLVNTGETTAALLVDQVLDAREVIVQDAGALLRRLPGVAAATLRDDGRPMLILNVQGILDATAATTHASAVAKLRRRASITRVKVFVVDDALSVRRAMQQVLEDSGFEVVACKDGQDAIERLRDGAPSMIFTDLEMPVVNGVELTRRIRENPEWAAIPVVMITSRASDKHRQIAADAGVDAFLTKPYADADLIAHARNRSRKPSLPVQTAENA